jgi:hypothetical protein
MMISFHVRPGLGRRIEGDGGDAGFVEFGGSSGQQVGEAVVHLVPEGVEIQAQAGGTEGFEIIAAGVEELDGSAEVAVVEVAQGDGSLDEALVETALGGSAFVP